KYIAEQIALVKTLEEKGYTYVTSDGVYFNTAKFPTYGKLGNINLEGQQEGARVQENAEKRNPHDFAVWKFSKKDAEKRQQEWKSPWGVGFPGWHLECTAIIFTSLGKQIDIHIGGIDLIPIHHNNEIAQAEAATGKEFVHTWMHHEFITIEGRKISKSLGNTVYLHNIIDKGFNPQSLRYWYLTAHYRTPMNFTWDAIAGADQALTRLNRLYTELSLFKKRAQPDKKFMDDFYAALADDLDTPRMLARLWELVKEPNISPATKRASLLEADSILGLGFSKRRPAAKLKVGSEPALPQEVKELMQQREEARKNKNFASADILRDKIEQVGYEVVDTSEGSKISKK
ncbi:MAG: class I tRNA ligase family protein, partial [bacterium]|nr:class I tRNA ligase family protein [bacterium]